ncbi:MAG TPA: VOC family protein [Pseudomonadales bacterium]
MNYTLSVVRVFVTDWERAVHFYTQTLEMKPAFIGDGWAEFDTGQAHLALERVDPDDPEAAEFEGRFLAVSLQVDDIHGVHKTLASRGVEFVGGPEQQPWGGWLAHLRDPDGNVLTLLGERP